MTPTLFVVTNTGRKNEFTWVANVEQISDKLHFCLILLIFAQWQRSSLHMGIFTTALKKKKGKFSIKIPHLTSTVHRLLSDR